MPGLIHKITMEIIRRRGMPGVDDAIKKGLVFRETLSTKLKDKFGISVSGYDGHDIFSYGSLRDGDPIVYFLHGGGFRIGMSNVHYSALGRMHKYAKCAIIAPDFPLPPEADAQGVIDFIVSHLLSVLSRFPSSPIVLAGDSAGAHLALSCTRVLAAQERDRLRAVFLLFGVFDLSRSADDFVMHKEEVLLKREVLRKMPSGWAGNLSLHDPIVSPIFGHYDNLPPLYMYSADKDPLYVDSCELEAKLAQNGNTYFHHVFNGYSHDFILFPTPDGNKALRHIADQINTVIYP